MWFKKKPQKPQPIRHYLTLEQTKKVAQLLDDRNALPDGQRNLANVQMWEYIDAIVNPKPGKLYSIDTSNSTRWCVIEREP